MFKPKYFVTIYKSLDTNWTGEDLVGGTIVRDATIMLRTINTLLTLQTGILPTQEKLPPPKSFVMAETILLTFLKAL